MKDFRFSKKWLLIIFISSITLILVSEISFNQAWAGANTAPTVDAGADDTLDEGDTFSQSGSFTDPDTDIWTATVDYGDTAVAKNEDGTCPADHFPNADDTATCILPAESLVLNSDKTFLLSHTYEQDGDLINGGLPFKVIVTINDGMVDPVDTVLVTVNNILPTVDPIANATLDQGETFTAMNLFFTDPGSDVWTAEIIWGDTEFQNVMLETDKTFEIIHTFLNVGVFTVTLRIGDGVNVQTDANDKPIPLENEVTFTVTVNNVVPTLDPGTGDTINEGDIFTTSGSFTDPGDDPWEVTVDYGDGAGTINIGFEEVDKTIVLTHVYEDDGMFTVTVTVDDDTDLVSDTFLVTVNNVAPVVDAGPDATIDEGDAFLSAGSFVDPGTEPWEVTVDYGDGTVEQPALNTDNTFSLNHVYVDEGTYAVTVTVDDKTITATDTALVTVNNVAPTVTLGISSVDDTRTFSRSGAFTDPGMDDSWSATVDYGDGGVVEILTLNPDNTFSLNHQYSANGAYDLEVIVTDNGGGAGPVSTKVGIFVSDDEPPTDLQAPNPATSTKDNDATFKTSNQDIWTPITQGKPLETKTNLFTPQSWNENFGDDNSNDYVTIAGKKFGVGIDGNTNGNLGMFYKGGNIQGKVDVDYPGEIALTFPSVNSFLAGANVPLRGQWTLDDGAVKMEATTLGDLKLFLNFRVHGDMKREICVLDGCSDIFKGEVKEVNVPKKESNGSQKIAEIEIFSITEFCLVFNDIPNAVKPALDPLGSIKLTQLCPISVSPKIDPESVDDGTITIQDTKQFAEINIDLDKIATFGLPVILDLSTGTVKIDGIENKLEYIWYDAKNFVKFTANQKLTFDTVVLIKLEFSKPVSGVTGSFLSTTPTADGKISSVTYVAGEEIQIVFPSDETQPITVTPTAFLDPAKTKMHNFAKIIADSEVKMKALELTAKLGEITVKPPEPIYYPWPHTDGWECHGALCFGGHYHHPGSGHGLFHIKKLSDPVVFGGVDWKLGPEWTTSLGKIKVERDIANSSFELEGFNTVTLDSFLLDPEVPPTADADGPYEVNEGEIILLDGSGSFDIDLPPQPLTHNWDLDNGGSFETNGESVDFIGIDGPAFFPVTIEVCDALNCDRDSSSVVVINVPPVPEIHGADVSSTRLNEFTFSATDVAPDEAAGFLYEIDWGDGTTDSITSFTIGSVVLSHSFNNIDEYTISVTAEDKDGGVSTPVTHTLTIPDEDDDGVADGTDTQPIDPLGNFVDISCVVGTFDPDTETCVGEFIPNCPEDTVFNPDTNLCEADSIDCPDDTIFNPDTNLCEAQSTECPADTVFNPVTNLCEVQPTGCPTDTSFNVETNLCEATVTCPADTVFNPDTNLCEVDSFDCPEDTVFNPDTNLCEAQSTCPVSTIFNPETNVCEVKPTDCPADTNYNPVTNLCEAPVSNSESSPGTSSGQLVDSGDQDISILEESNPDGIFFNADDGGGTSPGLIVACDKAGELEVDSGDSGNIECGSITISIISGSVEVQFNTGGFPATTTMVTTNSLTFDDDVLTITNNSLTDDAVILIGGRTIILAPGETINIRAFAFPPTSKTSYQDPNLGDVKHGKGHDNGFCMNQNCINVDGFFNHFPETTVPQGSTQTFSLLINCPRGVNTCNHASLAGVLPDSDFYEEQWSVTLDRQPRSDIWDMTVSNPYGEIGEVTTTVQEVGQSFLSVSFNVEFLIPGSVGTADGLRVSHENNRYLHVTVWDANRGISNYVFNEGVYVDDIYAFPKAESTYEKPIELEPLCLNENPNKRYTCAFDKVRQWTIKNAEKQLDEINSVKGYEMMEDEVIEEVAPVSILKLSGTSVPATIPLHQGYYNGERVYYIITDSSDSTHADIISKNQGWKVQTATRLADAPDAALSKTYMFTNGLPGDGVHGFQGEVFTSTPAQDVYSALTSHVQVTWDDASTPFVLDSEKVIMYVAKQGLVTLSNLDVVSNMPQIVWPEGQMSVKVDKKLTDSTPFGGGQVLDIDLDEKTVTFIAHRGLGADGRDAYYIVTDATPIGPANIMGVTYTPANAALLVNSAPVEMFQFMNGIKGHGPMGFQEGIVNSAPGESNYSPMMRVFMVEWFDPYSASFIENKAEIDSYLRDGLISVNLARPMYEHLIVNAPFIDPFQ